MNLFSTPESKVGLLVVVVSVLVGAMSMRVSESPNFMGGTKRVFFEVDDAGGLIKNSPVNVAGIRVGMIEDIKLRDGKAVVELVVRPDVHLTKSAKIEIKSSTVSDFSAIPDCSKDKHFSCISAIEYALITL